MENLIDTLPVTWAGLFLYYCLPYRRRVVFQNMDRVYGNTLSLSQKKHLAQAFYSHIACCLQEALMMRFMSQDKMRARVDLEGGEYLLQQVAEKKGVLILTGHFGNWEFAPIAGIMNFKAYEGQFHFIRRTLGSKWLERILFRRYYQAGLKVIPQRNALDKVCAALEAQQAVVFVLDQHASVVNRDGIAVEFFGEKAGTYRSLASIARNMDLPVIPASSYRKPDGRHVLKFHPPIPFQAYNTTQQTLYKNTKRYNEALERIILEHPEQWSWFHKRWKL